MAEAEENKKAVFVFVDAVANAPAPPTCSLWYISEALDWIMVFLYAGLLVVRRTVEFDFYFFILIGSMAMYALWGIVELRMYYKWAVYEDLLEDWVEDNYTMPDSVVAMIPTPQRRYPQLMFSITWVFVILSVFTAPFNVIFSGMVVIVTNYVARVICFKCSKYGTVEEALCDVIGEYY